MCNEGVWPSYVCGYLICDIRISYIQFQFNKTAKSVHKILNTRFLKLKGDSKDENHVLDL